MVVTVNVHHFFGSGIDNTILKLLEHVHGVVDETKELADHIHEVVDRIDENVIKLLDFHKVVGIVVKPESPVPRSPEVKES